MPAAHPVHAAPRPLLDLLSRAMIALFEPIEPAPYRRSPVAPAGAGRWSGFDASTYQRRRLRIAGLEDEDGRGPGDPVVRAPAGSTRPGPRPRA